MGIKDFVNVKENKVEIYEKAIEDDLSEPEKRQLEMELLKPEKIPAYIGKTPTPLNNINSRTVKLVFPNNKSFSLLKKFFNIREYVENCISDLELFLLFLEALETGEIKYDKENKKLTYNI
jgi:hypothetical protein